VLYTAIIELGHTLHRAVNLISGTELLREVTGSFEL